MSQQHDKHEQEEVDILEEMEEEIEEIENDEGEVEEEKLESAQHGESTEVTQLKDALLRTQADFENFKKRTERDRDDMIFFLKSDIFKKILPRVDDLERMIANTPEDMQTGVLYEGVVALEKSLKKDLEKLGVEGFVSIGESVDPEKHDVMTQVPGKEEGIICDEFEKGYMLSGRVLRHAKVVVGAGE
ncbi:MAG: nucleotide exchange factor GrpE [Candidatus Peribacteria bacterium]|nr:MAG: nucleotide exchange factor GrpE [Candidatus Peribacteria bacterium]